MKAIMLVFFFETFDAKLNNLNLVVDAVVLHLVRARNVVEVITESGILAVVERFARGRTNMRA